MGEIPKTTSKTQYYHLFDGKICRTVKQPIEGVSETRTNKNGDQVHEIFVGGLSGSITDIKKKGFDVNGVEEFAWEIVLEDNDGRYVLSVPVNSRIAQQILSRLPNVDFGKEVIITTGKGFDEDKGKDFMWANVHQGKDKIASYFTKENPNGLPPLQLVKFKGKESWDNTDQLAFFEKMVSEDIVPRIERAKETISPEQGGLNDDPPIQRNVSSLVDANDATPSDDLPF